MYSIPDFMALAVVTPCMQCEAKKLPQVESSQPGTMIGRFFRQLPTTTNFLDRFDKNRLNPMIARYRRNIHVENIFICF